VSQNRTAPFLRTTFADFVADQALTYHHVRALYDDDEEWRAAFLREHDSAGDHVGVPFPLAVGKITNEMSALASWSRGLNSLTNAGLSSGEAEIQFDSGLFASTDDIAVFLTCTEEYSRRCVWTKDDIVNTGYDIRLRSYAVYSSPTLNSVEYLIVVWGVAG
jgi:hypothetical protein